MGRNAELIERWFEQVWNEGSTKAIDAMLADPCTILGLDSQPIECCDDFKAFHATGAERP